MRYSCPVPDISAIVVRSRDGCGRAWAQHGIDRSRVGKEKSAFTPFIGMVFSGDSILFAIAKWLTDSRAISVPSNLHKSRPYQAANV